MNNINKVNPFLETIRKEVDNLSGISDDYKPRMKKILIEITNKHIKNLGDEYIDHLDDLFKNDKSIIQEFLIDQYGSYVIRERQRKVLIAIIAVIILNITNYLISNNGMTFLSNPIAILSQHFFQISIIVFGVYSLITFKKKWH